MKRLVQCVPNFSNGTDEDVIDAIRQAAVDTGVTVISCEADADYNRTVLTFVADPDRVIDGAFAVIATSADLIDMRHHKGGHPRMGACDVCPFVPIGDVSIDECVSLAKKLGDRVGRELQLPVYLYGAAGRTGRRDLAEIRKGQYEALEEKMKRDDYQPDFGPAQFNSKFGAVLIGARPFMHAYNVNLASNDVDAANAIAKRIRTSGRKVDGVSLPGTLKAVKGLGVLLKEKNIAQVSMNLLDYRQTGLHIAFEEVKKFAGQFGQRVTGSEICGVATLDALVLAGRFYGGQELDDQAAALLAVEKLGLGDLEPFEPEKKVLEWAVEFHSPKA